MEGQVRESALVPKYLHAIEKMVHENDFFT